MGKPGGRRTKYPGSIEVWTRELRGGDHAVAIYFDAPGRFALTAERVGWTAPLVAVRDVVNRTSLGIYKRNAVIGVESSTAHSVRCFRFSRLFGSASTIV